MTSRFSEGIYEFYTKARSFSGWLNISDHINFKKLKAKQFRTSNVGSL